MSSRSKPVLAPAHTLSVANTPSDQGVLELLWQDPARPGKPPRHAYKVTPTGLAFLRTSTSATTFSALRRKIAGATS
jgi:hypothetical protein